MIMAEKYYCNKCYKICDKNECDECGKKNLSNISDDDIVYLTTKNFVISGILDDLLTTENIYYLKKGQKGAGVSNTIGFLAETYNYYVHFSNLDKALEIVDMVAE